MKKRDCGIFLIAAAMAALLSACSVEAPSQDEDLGSFDKVSSSAKPSPLSSSSNLSSGTGDASQASRLEKIYDAVVETGKYTTRDSVAAYLCKFDKLPANYVGKNKGKKLYEANGKTFEKWNFNPWTTIGFMIGGDNFDNFANASNYHENLPEGKYHEADVEYSGKNRGTKRLVYQPNCVIYYTADHYETYSRLKF